jgi:hypothetical protein
VEAIKYCTPNLWILDFFHGMQAPCFQHMPCVKKNWDRIGSQPHTILPYMVHPTLVCLPWLLPWTINMLWNPHVNVVPKHKTI